MHTIVCDDTDEAQVQAACALAGEVGRSTMVVANAGTGSAAPHDVGGLGLGTVDDIANSVRFLLGEESSWITGQCISTDGGHHLRRGPNLAPLMELVMGADAHSH